MSRRIRRIAVTLLSLSTALTLTAASNGRQLTLTSPPIERAQVENSVDEGLMSSEFPMILSTNSDSAANSRWMELETDPCGLLSRVENSRSMFRQSGFDDMNDFDDPDSSDQGRALIDRWLSEHADIAVINDEIDKSCDNDWFDGEGFTPEFLARFVNGRNDAWARRERASHIA